MNEYALTAKEWEWLEERKERKEPFPPPFIEWIIIQLRQERDAAEFEARVAAKLAGAWAIGEDMCFSNHCQLFDKDRCTACYIKNARIATEEEMDNARN